AVIAVVGQADILPAILVNDQRRCVTAQCFQTMQVVGYQQPVGAVEGIVPDILVHLVGTVIARQTPLVIEQLIKVVIPKVDECLALVVVILNRNGVLTFGEPFYPTQFFATVAGPAINHQIAVNVYPGPIVGNNIKAVGVFVEVVGFGPASREVVGRDAPFWRV